MDEAAEPGLISNLEQRIDLCRTNKIIFREPADRMSHILNATLVIANRKIGMMILAMRYPGNSIDEGDGLIIVLEVILFLQSGCREIPSRQAGASVRLLHQGKAADAAFAGLACLGGEIVGRWYSLALLLLIRNR